MIRAYAKKLGGHYHIDFFIGPMPGSGAKMGSLVCGEDEYDLVKRTIMSNVQVTEE